jgi:hypothetical protein
VVVHPLVLLSVVDHYNRVSSVRTVPRVVGLLLGGKKADNTLDVANSFASQFFAFFMKTIHKIKNTKFLKIDKNLRRQKKINETWSFHYFSKSATFSM